MPFLYCEPTRLQAAVNATGRVGQIRAAATGTASSTDGGEDAITAVQLFHLLFVQFADRFFVQLQFAIQFYSFHKI